MVIEHELCSQNLRYETFSKYKTSLSLNFLPQKQGSDSK